VGAVRIEENRGGKKASFRSLTRKIFDAGNDETKGAMALESKPPGGYGLRLIRR